MAQNKKESGPRAFTSRNKMFLNSISCSHDPLCPCVGEKNPSEAKYSSVPNVEGDHVLRVTTGKVLWDNLFNSLNATLGRNNLSAKQSTESMSMKYGQVCFYASLKFLLVKLNEARKKLF